jgi:hypothetical protein
MSKKKNDYRPRQYPKLVFKITPLSKPVTPIVLSFAENSNEFISYDMSYINVICSIGLINMNE